MKQEFVVEYINQKRMVVLAFALFFVGLGGIALGAFIANIFHFNPNTIIQIAIPLSIGLPFILFKNKTVDEMNVKVTQNEILLIDSNINKVINKLEIKTVNFYYKKRMLPKLIIKLKNGKTEGFVEPRWKKTDYDSIYELYKTIKNTWNLPGKEVNHYL